MSAAIFICGTDTGVGKTVCGRALCAAFVRRGLRVAPQKPCESGCSRDAGTAPGMFGTGLCT